MRNLGFCQRSNCGQLSIGFVYEMSCFSPSNVGDINIIIIGIYWLWHCTYHFLIPFPISLKCSIVCFKFVNLYHEYTWHILLFVDGNTRTHTQNPVCELEINQKHSHLKFSSSSCFWDLTYASRLSGWQTNLWTISFGTNDRAQRHEEEGCEGPTNWYHQGHEYT